MELILSTATKDARLLTLDHSTYFSSKLLNMFAQAKRYKADFKLSSNSQMSLKENVGKICCVINQFRQFATKFSKCEPALTQNRLKSHTVVSRVQN